MISSPLREVLSPLTKVRSLLWIASVLKRQLTFF